ncbi:MAG: DNA-deoxyinosine glycosylase [Lachnospiraceae bacterium]|jgi:hypoxanthine-DNA glycosylase|nr:DNA-deoxyinosine glycosylase [Lachnospiraceae bacterium]MEE3462155.1 DNA-deoxyinosine glycosylase [Lachnospiraceae bacterium]
MTRLDHGFGPYIDDESRILILGSFPSVKSREAAFFYGHPQNRFWKVLENVFEDSIRSSCLSDDPSKTDIQHIEEKKSFLKRHHIALYDSIESCSIEGSSDASIRDAVPADIPALIKKAPIERIFVNGRTSEKYYNKYIFPACGVTCTCLPSTSPANAAWDLKRLTEEWKVIRTPEIKYVKPSSAFYDDKDISDGYLDLTGDIPLIRSKVLSSSGIFDAAFSTKLGGVSSGILGSLNLGFSRGDREENLKKNFEICAEAMGSDLKHMIATDQVHGTKIVKADRSMGLGSELTRKKKSVDGLWTDEKGLVLCASFADCVPVIIADQRSAAGAGVHAERTQGRIALVHSGWKGTVGQISAIAAEILVSEGSRKKDLEAFIGPSISGDHYQVTSDVIDSFAGVYSREELKDICRQTDKIHYQLDLWAAIWHTLVNAGLKPENIHFSGICTWENADILWSHRRSGGRRGNMNAFARIV